MSHGWRRWLLNTFSNLILLIFWLQNRRMLWDWFSNTIFNGLLICRFFVRDFCFGFHWIFGGISKANRHQFHRIHILFLPGTLDKNILHFGHSFFLFTHHWFRKRISLLWCIHKHYIEAGWGKLSWKPLHILNIKHITIERNLLSRYKPLQFAY